MANKIDRRIYSGIWQQLDELHQASPVGHVLRAVVGLHAPWHIWDECGHTHHTRADGYLPAGVLYVDEVGYVCDDGWQYTICRHCCTGDDDYQTEDCVYHRHGPGIAHCQTIATIAERLGVAPQEPADA